MLVLPVLLLWFETPRCGCKLTVTCTAALQHIYGPSTALIKLQELPLAELSGVMIVDDQGGMSVSTNESEDETSTDWAQLADASSQSATALSLCAFRCVSTAWMIACCLCLSVADEAHCDRSHVGGAAVG